MRYTIMSCAENCETDVVLFSGNPKAEWKRVSYNAGGSNETVWHVTRLAAPNKVLPVNQALQVTFRLSGTPAVANQGLGGLPMTPGAVAAMAAQNGAQTSLGRRVLKDGDDRRRRYFNRRREVVDSLRSASEV